MSTKIKFVAIENHAHASTKTGACVASVIHNGVWTKETLSKEVAKRSGLPLLQANMFMDALDEAVCEGISTGNKVNFGLFSIGIAMKGSLKEANSRFDATKNALGAFFAPGRKILRALGNLEPENATEMDRPWLWEVACEGVGGLNSIKVGACVFANGVNIRVDSSKEDEGVWLEDGTGAKVAKAEIVSTDSSCLRCVFSGPVATGPSRLAIYTRDGGAANGAVGVVRRRVKVVG